MVVATIYTPCLYPDAACGSWCLAPVDRPYICLLSQLDVNNVSLSRCVDAWGVAGRPKEKGASKGPSLRTTYVRMYVRMWLHGHKKGNPERGFPNSGKRRIMLRSVAGAWHTSEALPRSDC